MKKWRNILIYQLLFMCLFLVFAISCEKDEVAVPKSFTDPRDSTEYQTVLIGDQVWMAENLKYLPDVVGPVSGSPATPYYYVPGFFGMVVSDAKATDNYNIYGVLYNWEAAIEACPTGWHLPTDAEWTELTDFLGGESVAGGQLKETGTTHWYSPNTGATNATGFTALPGGFRFNTGTFGSFNFGGFWWSASEGDTGLVVYRGVNNSTSDVGRYDSGKEFGFSVRCLRD